MSVSCLQPNEDLSIIAEHIADGTASPESMRYTLLRLAETGENGPDLLAFALAFRARSVPVYTRHAAVMDLCGTGGASFRTFNVSTIASFVVAGCGVPVAKHGNRSANGICGSADLMTQLGVDIMMSPQTAGRLLDRHGITFLYAPNYHPALRHVAPVRKELRRRTLFNVLGPLLNPVRTERRQLLGVADPRLLEIIPSLLPRIGVERAALVHGHPGMDELSTLGPSVLVEVSCGQEHESTIDPSTYSIPVPSQDSVREVPPDHAAAMALDVLSGNPSPLSDMVAFNSAAALKVFGRAKDLGHGLELARESLSSGAALEKLQSLIEGSREGGR